MSQARKLKTQFLQDVRRWHDLQDFAALREFVKSSYGTALPPAYMLHYQDEEQDMVTIATDADLDAAFTFAESQGRVLKVFVTPLKGAKQEKSKMEDEQVPAAPRGFFDLIREEPDFRAQFIAFVQAFLTALRDDESISLQRVFGEALAAFPEIAQHPDVVQAKEMILPMAFVALQPYTVFLTAIDPSRVGAVLDKIIDMIQASGSAPHGFMPMFMPPPFGMHKMFHHLFRGHGPRGRHWRHFAGRRSRGPWGCRARRHPKGGCRGRRGRCAPPEPVFRAQPWFCPSEEGPYRSGVLKSDVSLADGAVILPKQVVIKTWKVKNTGTEDWPEGTVISYVGEPLNPLVNGASFPVDAVKAGEEADIAVVLEAPDEGGEYSCQWRLVAPEDHKFGQLMTARVVVAGPQTARIVCHCGKQLYQAQAHNVYAPGAQVECDGCGAAVESEQLAYHCAGGRNHAHPHGWDLCLSCARSEMVKQGVVSSADVFVDEKPPVAPAPVAEPEPVPAREPAPEDETKADKLRLAHFISGTYPNYTVAKLMRYTHSQLVRCAAMISAENEQAAAAPQEVEEQKQEEEQEAVHGEEAEAVPAPLPEAEAEAEAEAAPEVSPPEEPEYPDWATLMADRDLLKQFYSEYLAAMRAEDEANKQEQQQQQEEEEPQAVVPAEEEPEAVEDLPQEDDSEEVKPAVEAKPYKFAAQLTSLKELGFDMDEETLKALLEQNGGRVDLVVNTMLGL